MTNNKINSKSAAVFFFLLLFISSTFDADGQTNSNTISTENVVDLTHTLDENFPFIPIPGITFPFKKTPIATIEKLGVAAFRWEIHEHIGTQIDAPSHFFADGLSLEQMPVRQFIAPLAVIDISTRARADADTAVTIEDIKNWEKKYGRLPKGAAVFMYSGWDAKVKDAKAFINMDDANTMHFPGFSAEAALFLARERDVVGIGVDTVSLDPGNDKAYKAHKAWLAAGKWGVECVANLKQVPPVGATVFVGAPKVGGATGGLVRLIATFPASAMKSSSLPVTNEQLSGTWKSAAAENIGSGIFRTRKFTFTKERWLIEVVIYGDKEMTEALFSFVGEGPYKLGEVSTIAPGATNAVFRFDKKSLTLLTADKAIISRFKFDECGLSGGVPKDVSAKGCSNFTSIAVCGQEYDLVKIEKNKLQLGARPADGIMCSEEKRPKSLGSPLIKQNN
ncbi:MAG: cyclase family protein [Acidobacteria bacterium]|nr:cyclase family protein [Acidobacteriota bacterium]